MTTDPRRLSMSPGTRVLVRSLGGLLAVVAALVVVAFIAAGADAAATVLTGGVVSAVVLAAGSWAVHVVATLMPTASMLVALMTYALQIALLTAFMALVSDSPEWGTEISPGWFAAAVIAAVLAWTTLQIVFATRARIPTYDLASRDSEAGR